MSQYSARRTLDALIPVIDDLVPPQGPAFDDPVATAGMFLAGLMLDLEHYRTAMLQLVTPESQEAFGDFTEAAATLAAMGQWGMGNVGTRPSPDTAHIVVMPNAGPETLYATRRVPIPGAQVVSLVYSQVRQGWLVHAFGPA